MGKSIISSFDEFAQIYPNLTKSNSRRIESLKKYLSKGGVISLQSRGRGWPKLTYPNPIKLKTQIEDLNSLKKQYKSEIKTWQKTFTAAKTYELKHSVLKFSNPLYWIHLSKQVLDSEYREDTNKVSLPAHLICDPKWTPMIKMFVTDYDYRKQLSDTVENSIVYKNDKRVARYAKDLQQFRVDISTKKTNDIKQKIAKLDHEINFLNEILNWSKK